MYSNTTAAENGGERIWSIGYRTDAGDLYVGADNGTGKDDWQTKYFGSPGANSVTDGRWHHVAVTFEPDGNGDTRTILYKDYAPVGTNTIAGLLMLGDNLSYSCMALGNNFDGWVDELRISKGVLPVSQMLHVVRRGTAICIR